MPSTPAWQAPYQRLYHPSTAGQPALPSEVVQLRAAAVQAVGHLLLQCHSTLQIECHAATCTTTILSPTSLVDLHNQQ